MNQSLTELGMGANTFFDQDENLLAIREGVSKVCQQFPDIEMQLSMTKDLVDLGAMEADLAIRMTPTPPDYLMGSEIMKLQHGIYTSKTNSLSSVEKIILFNQK